MRILLAVAYVSLGCNDYYLSDKDPPPPPPLDADHCAQICEDWGLTLGPIGCDINCGITSYPNGTLIDGIVDFGVVDDGGNHCTLSVTCPDDADLCQSTFAMALSATEDIDGAFAQFNTCYQMEICADQWGTCMEAAETDYDECQCNNYQDLCNGGEGIPCEDDPPPLPPPPTQTAPTTWSVPRAWLDFELAHVAALKGTTPYWPVRGANGKWIGARLAGITPASPLFAAGIRDHDLLRSVNGIPVIQAMQNPALVMPLKTASVITLAITRNGAPRTLTYNVH